MTPDSAAAHCAALVKEREPARYVTALFAPAVTRRFLLALYALAAELKWIRRTAREPMIVAMRFQWWRDALGALPAEPRGQPILHELAGAIEFGALAAEPLIALADAHESEIEPALAEIGTVALAARICGAGAGSNPLADAVGIAIATGSRELLAEARRIWRAEKKARRGELPAYLPAAFVDARHPVTDASLRWRALTRGLANRF